VRPKPIVFGAGDCVFTRVHGMKVHPKAGCVKFKNLSRPSG
jgi:hypothetical protein